MEIRRYEMECTDWDSYEMVESNDGDYILFDDHHAALSAARAEVWKEAIAIVKEVYASERDGLNDIGCLTVISIIRDALRAAAEK